MMETTLRKVNMETFLISPERYELRSGSDKNAPFCPYGNHYEWIGFDKVEGQYVRFTKSVFKKLVREIEG